MAESFSDNDLVNKAIFEESKLIFGEAKLADKGDISPKGFDRISLTDTNKLNFSLDLFRKKMDFGLLGTQENQSLIETGSYGFTDPEPTKTWRLNDDGTISDYGYHDIKDGSAYAYDEKQKEGEVELNPGQEINQTAYTNKKLSQEQAVNFLTTILEVAKGILRITDNEDAIKSRQNEVDKYQRMFDTYTKELDSENEVLLAEYQKNNRPNPLKKNTK